MHKQIVGNTTPPAHNASTTNSSAATTMASGGLKRMVLARVYRNSGAINMVARAALSALVKLSTQPMILVTWYLWLLRVINDLAMEC
jgi:hypothetical protein